MHSARQGRERSVYDWRLFALVWFAGSFSSLAGIPEQLTQHQHTFGLPMIAHIAAVRFVNSTILISILAGLGLRVTRSLGLGLPFIEAWLERRRPPLTLRPILVQAAAIGILLAMVLIPLEVAVFFPRIPELGQLSLAPLWQRLLSPIGAGIFEEVLFRLGLLTLIIWLFARMIWASHGRITPGTFWCANLVVAVLFGLAHYPFRSPYNPLGLAQALLVPGLASLVLGYQYWRYGLESAIVTHFVTDEIGGIVSPFIPHA